MDNHKDTQNKNKEITMIHIYDQQLPDGTNEVFDDPVESTDTPYYLGHAWNESDVGFGFIEIHAYSVFSHIIIKGGSK